MELDELKNIWKQESFRSKNEGEIAAMLRGRSRSIVSKLKRSVWMELTLTLIGELILVYYVFTIPAGAFKWATLSFALLFAGYIVYYFKKIILLIRFGATSENIKINIERLVHDLGVYLSFYKKSYTMVYPVFLFLMLFFVAIEQGIDDFLRSLTRPLTLASLVFVCLVFIGCLVWFTNWYLDKLYGNHLRKLEELLKDLRTEEE
jgi:hypothetical protein